MHLPTTPYPRFHLAFPVTDLDEARRFYGAFLGCAEGRSSPEWVDFDFFGHQIVAHKVERSQMSPKGRPEGESDPERVGAEGSPATDATSLVDGQDVPVRHFGIVTDIATWEARAERFKAAGVKFIIAPYVRFRGQPGEQATMFFLDPFGNALEFKAFADMDRLFAKQ